MKEFMTMTDQGPVFVKGEIVGGVFGVHREDVPVKNKTEKQYPVTHLPSGLAIARLSQKRFALELARRLLVDPPYSWQELRVPTEEMGYFERQPHVRRLAKMGDFVRKTIGETNQYFLQTCGYNEIRARF